MFFDTFRVGSHCSLTPFLQPILVSDDKRGILLQWHRIYFPPYDREPALQGYTVQVLELPSKEWKTLAVGLTEKHYLVPNLKQNRDYVFRVIGQTENGEYTEPSPALPVLRTEVPDYQVKHFWSLDESDWERPDWRRFERKEPESPESNTSEVSYQPRRRMLASEESIDSLFESQASLSASSLHLDEDDGVINRPYFEMLTCKVPPRMPLEPPELIDDGSDVAWLLWKPASVPHTTKISMTKSITYSIEMRLPPSYDWNTMVEELVTTKYKITNLLPDRNYDFRVRCYNEFGGGEATLPVTMRRTTNGLFDDFPNEVDSEEDLVDWENFDGERVPPRLPLDKPDITITSNDSLILTWAHARNPAYGKYSPITYTVEVKEQWARAWRTLVTNLTETRFHVKNLQPNASYSFHVMAENEFGVSEPSMTATLHRPVQTSQTNQDVAKVDKLLLPSATFVDPLAVQTPPRVPVGRPKISDENGTSLVLSWKAARIPSYAKKSSVTYVIEAREPPAPNWVPIVTDIDDTKFEIRNLKEEQDYMFRIRACNEVGLSEASLPATLYREIDYIKQLQRQLSTESSTILSPDILSPDEPKSFFWDTDGKIPYPPEFLSDDEVMQYGVEFCMMKIELHIQAFPPPKVFWYFKEEKIEYGDRYTAYIKPGGIVTLEFPDLTWSDVGDYKCYIENELGFASQIVTLNLAEPPTIIKNLEDLFLVCSDNGILECQVDGIPYPTVSWFKDRAPLFESSRVHAYHELPGRWFLVFVEAGLSDNGTYECVIENAGGRISCTAQVEVSEFKPAPSYLLFREAKLESFYYVLEEIGRGRHAVIRRLVEKSSGKEFAGKFLVVNDAKEKEFFSSELECLRMLDHEKILQVHDAYETDRSLALVTELIHGGELLDMILTSFSWTESDAAFYIKQLLSVLEALKLRGVAHLDIKPSNIMYDQEKDCIKLIDFGFAKKIHNFPLKLNYGTPEYSSPEVVCSEVITESTDLWSVGVLTYILLSGISPFYGGSVQETLNLVENTIWQFDEEAFKSISSEAKDFISCLLKKDPLDRLEIDECLSHPWMEFAKKKGQGSRLNLKNLEAFHRRDLAMRKKNAVLRNARLESLTKMELVVPTTPALLPQVDPETGKTVYPDSREYGEFLDSEARFDWNKRYERRSESEFSLRSREFLRLAHDQTVAEVDNEGGQVIGAVEDEEMMRSYGRDRRRLSELDIDHDKLLKMEKEVEWISASSDERLERQINREKEGQVYVMERKPSVGMPKEGYRPIFRAKLTDQVVRVGENVTFMCLIRGRPTVTVAWYKNEEFLTKSNRIRMSLSEDGVSSMTLISAKTYDVGVYKCVARNKMGRTACRAKLILGDNPGRPERPIVTGISSSEALLIWDPPAHDGDCPILFYRVHCKKADDYQWTKSLKTINECAYIGNLAADTSYVFRVSCQNKFGLSPYSLASKIAKTQPENSAPLSLCHLPDYAIMLCRNAQTILSLNQTQGPTNVVEYYRDRDDEVMNFDPAEQYDFLENITRGAFCNWKLCRSKRSRELYLSRHTPYENESEDLLKEFSLLVTVQHVNVITVIGAFLHNNIHTVVFEYLDSENILEHLSSRTRYSEDEVARIITQLLDALQYLHFLCIIHLNLQPDNILMGRLCPILKLKDFSLAQKIVTPIGKHVPQAGHPEFMAPEVVVGEPAGVAADVWGVGIIATLLLSGETPYVGSTKEETLGNIAYNRFDGTIMYENVSKEALKFISKIVKRIPTNRMTADDCLEHNWLQQSEDIVKTRKQNVFMGFKLRNFAKHYEDEKGASSKFSPVPSIMADQPERKFKMPDVNEITVKKQYSYREKTASQRFVSFDNSYLESKLASNYKRVTEDLALRTLTSLEKDFSGVGAEGRSGLYQMRDGSHKSCLTRSYSATDSKLVSGLSFEGKIKPKESVSETQGMLRKTTSESKLLSSSGLEGKSKPQEVVSETQGIFAKTSTESKLLSSSSLEGKSKPQEVVSETQGIFAKTSTESKLLSSSSLEGKTKPQEVVSETQGTFVKTSTESKHLSASNEEGKNKCKDVASETQSIFDKTTSDSKPLSASTEEGKSKPQEVASEPCVALSKTETKSYQELKKEIQASSESTTSQVKAESSKTDSIIQGQDLQTGQMSISVNKSQVQSSEELSESSSKPLTSEQAVCKSEETAGATSEIARATIKTQEVMVQEQKTVSLVQQSETTVLETATQVLQSKSMVAPPKISALATSDKVSAEALTASDKVSDKALEKVTETTPGTEERKQSITSTTSTSQETNKSLKSSGSSLSTSETTQGASVAPGSEKDLTASVLLVEKSTRSSETVECEEVIEEVVTTTTSTEVVTSVEETTEAVEVMESTLPIGQE